MKAARNPFYSQPIHKPHPPSNPQTVSLIATQPATARPSPKNYHPQPNPLPVMCIHNYTSYTCGHRKLLNVKQCHRPSNDCTNHPYKSVASAKTLCPDCARQFAVQKKGAGYKTREQEERERERQQGRGKGGRMW
jgi:hypothetical protein